MPVIKSAIKKLRKDRTREVRNDELRKQLRDALRSVRKNSTDSSTLKSAYSIIDKATKQNLMHKNKAARMKSQVAKIVQPQTAKKAKSAVSA